MGSLLEKAARYYLRRREYRADARYFAEVLRPRPVVARPGARRADVLLLLPEIRKHAGGCTSALRVAAALAKSRSVVVCATESGQSPGDMAECARFNVPGINATFIGPERLGEWSFEAGIATFWTTTYLLESMGNIAAKYYFVQDFEPDFYPSGDIRQMALTSYAKRLDIISLGAWNLEQIRSRAGRVGGSLHAVDFPFEPAEYPIIAKRYDRRPAMKACVYLKMDPKRAPYLVQEFVRQLSARFAAKGRSLETVAYGLPQRYQFEGLRNLGLLGKGELRQLYSQCDFGVTVSMSNISLVNYEMAACGLPVLDAREGSAPAFFGDEEMLYFSLGDLEGSADRLYDKLDDSEGMDRMVNACQAHLGTLSWSRTCGQFAAILDGVS